MHVTLDIKSQTIVKMTADNYGPVDNNKFAPCGHSEDKYKIFIS